MADVQPAAHEAKKTRKHLQWNPDSKRKITSLQAQKVSNNSSRSKAAFGGQLKPNGGFLDKKVIYCAASLSFSSILLKISRLVVCLNAILFVAKLKLEKKQSKSQGCKRNEEQQQSFHHQTPAAQSPTVKEHWVRSWLLLPIANGLLLGALTLAFKCSTIS